MPTLAEIWKPCQLIFGGSKYTGFMDPDGAHVVQATPGQMAQAAAQDGSPVNLPQFVPVYIDGWGHRMIPAEWVRINGNPIVVAGGIQQHETPKRKAPPPSPGKKPIKKAPPPPPRKRAPA